MQKNAGISLGHKKLNVDSVIDKIKEAKTKKGLLIFITPTLIVSL
jgi:hypothetical protein